MQNQLEFHCRLMTNFEALLVSPYLKAFLSIFMKRFLHFSLFDELQSWQVGLNFVCCFNRTLRVQTSKFSVIVVSTLALKVFDLLPR